MQKFMCVSYTQKKMWKSIQLLSSHQVHKQRILSTPETLHHPQIIMLILILIIY